MVGRRIWAAETQPMRTRSTVTGELLLLEAEAGTGVAVAVVRRGRRRGKAGKAGNEQIGAWGARIRHRTRSTVTGEAEEAGDELGGGSCKNGGSAWLRVEEEQGRKEMGKEQGGVNGLLVLVGGVSGGRRSEANRDGGGALDRGAPPLEPDREQGSGRCSGPGWARAGPARA